MSYTALYRKFRPSEFEDVKGQDHIVTTLQNQIKANRIGHAYLFCGTRGTGKTTVAKMKEYGKVVRVGTSKCCSDDTYSAYIGALLALARIYFPNASCDNKEIRFFNTKINPKEKSEYRCDKQFSHSDINKAIYNLISRYDIADTWVAESLNNFGTALHEELENMKEGK